MLSFIPSNTSSLDLMVLADFKGVQAPSTIACRAIPAMILDACTENNWEIPFTQLTLAQSQLILQLAIRHF